MVADKFLELCFGFLLVTFQLDIQGFRPDIIVWLGIVDIDLLKHINKSAI